MTYTAFRQQLLTAVARRDRATVTLEGFRRAAVLVPLVFTPGGADLLFTRRTEEVESHKGQISFPGGMVEETDRDITRTAVREADEELGLTEGVFETLGLLDDHATPSGFVITPVLGLAPDRPEITPNAGEVAEAFYVPLSFFASGQGLTTQRRTFLGREQEVWYYDTGTHVIWGATAAMIRGLLERLAMVTPVTPDRPPPSPR
jgi:8-oxo-dGTP pyrophosphatase MutT (NUDIX family)